jgi:predicted DCC family thiol-disulfide oxidoreductase YuxK
MPNSALKTTVFYDGSCPLCRAEIGMYKKIDASCNLHLIDVSESDPDLELPVGRDQAMARFHVMSNEGRLLSGAAAFIEVWRHLPRWRFAAKAASLPGIPPLLELAYRLFLPIRPSISRLVSKMQGAQPKCRSETP